MNAPESKSFWKIFKSTGSVTAYLVYKQVRSSFDGQQVLDVDDIKDIVDDIHFKSNNQSASSSQPLEKPPFNQKDA